MWQAGNPHKHWVKSKRKDVLSGEIGWGPDRRLRACSICDTLRLRMVQRYTEALHLGDYVSMLPLLGNSPQSDKVHEWIVSRTLLQRQYWLKPNTPPNFLVNASYTNGMDGTRCSMNAPTSVARMSSALGYIYAFD